MSDADEESRKEYLLSGRIRIQEKKMTTEEISKLARTGSLPQESMLTCPERCLYFTLVNLYAEYRDKKITAEQGEQEKKAAIVKSKC